MKIPEFIPYALDGKAFILSTSPPCYIGQVVQFTNQGAMTDFIASKKVNDGLCIAGKVPDHNILVIFAGSIGSKGLPENANVFKGMARFYYETRVQKCVKRYAKYITY